MTRISPPDPRTNPQRADLAPGTPGVAHTVTGGVVSLLKLPCADAEQASQVLFGEVFTVYEQRKDGWSWGQNALDGYVGWVRTTALSPVPTSPTHWLHALGGFIQAAPSVRAQVLTPITLGARLPVVGERNGYAELAGGGFLWAPLLRPLAETIPDFVATAERFVGVPYLWGGRSSLGLDCSALVQLSLMLAGLSCPRDSDMQQSAQGIAVDTTAYRRGDLVFCKGHVAIVSDPHTLVHANGHTMTVAYEPIEAFAARIKAPGITAVRRLG